MCRSVRTSFSPPPICRASSSTSRSARTCSCRYRRVHRPRWRARRCSRTCPAARSRLAAPKIVACCTLGVVALPGRLRLRRGGGGRIHHRPRLGRPDHDLGERRVSGQSERFPKGERRSIADVDLELLRSERLRMGTFDDNRAHHQHHCRIVPAHRVSARPADGRHRPAPQDRAVPVRPVGSARLEQDCYEAYNIQVAGLEQRLRALNYPKVVHRRLRWSGLDACADRRRPRDGPGRAAAQRHSRVHAARLRHGRAHQGQRDPARRGAGRDVRGDRHQGDRRADAHARSDHPFSRGEKVYDVTFENVQAGLRTDYLFRFANQRGGIVLGTGDLSELALGWSTYGVGDQMSHYNVNGGVPKTLIQHLIRWVISSNQFDDAVNEVLQSVLDTEISPELVPHGEDEEIQSSEAQGRTVCAAGLLAVPGAAVRLPAVEGGVPGLARLERSGARRLARRISAGQATGVLAQGDSALAAGLRAAVLLVLPVQAVGAAERARRCRTADRCRRAATGGRRRTCRPGPGWTRSNAKSPRTSCASFLLAARVTAPGISALANRHGRDDQRGDRIRPRPSGQCVEQQACQQCRGQIRAQQGLLRIRNGRQRSELTTGTSLRQRKDRHHDEAGCRKHDADQRRRPPRPSPAATAPRRWKHRPRARRTRRR